jgi:phosphoribosyl 1,2-cyclic phosphate phosphodiesterase
LRLRFLGTGTSLGVPVVGCSCEVCTSSDPRDRRTRHAALLESDDGARRVLVDTPPELRLQLLQASVDRIDAVWYTHEHADHTHGIDDLRAFSLRRQQDVRAFASPSTGAALRAKFSYIFDPKYSPPEGTTRPEISLQEVTPGTPVQVAGFLMQPLELPHGDVTVFGFRTGLLGYVTDAKRLPPAARAALAGVEVLVLNALWFGNPHPTHFNVEEAVETAREIGAPRTYLTHLTHRLRHDSLLAALPPGIRPAHDGLEISIPETDQP